MLHRTASLRVLFLCLGVSLLGVETSWSQEDATKWTSAQGKEIEAEFVALKEDGVVLKLKSSGREAEVPLASLSLESHLQAIKLANPEEFSKPLVKAVIEPAFEIPPLKPYDVDVVLQSPFSETQTLEDFVETFKTQLNDGNYFVLWHAMPEKMQADVTTLAAKAMEKVGSAPITQLRTLFRDLNTIVTEKEDFVFGYPDVANNRMIKKEMATQWPILKQMVQSLSDENLWQANNFQEENFERWLAEFLSALGSNQDAMVALVDHQTAGMATGTLNNMARVADSTPEAGQVEFTLPLPMPLDKVTFRKAGDVWVAPGLMNRLRTSVDQGLAEIDTIDESQVKLPIQTALGSVIPVFGALARAKTQEEFDAAVDLLKPFIEQAASQMPQGGMPGPPPGQGGGNFGPGGPAGPADGGAPGGRRNFGAPGMGAPGDTSGGEPQGRRNFGAPGIGGPGTPNG